MCGRSENLKFGYGEFRILLAMSIGTGLSREKLSRSQKPRAFLRVKSPGQKLQTSTHLVATAVLVSSRDHDETCLTWAVSLPVPHFHNKRPETYR